MKTQLHELAPSYYLVYFYRVSNRRLVFEDYLYVEFFPSSAPFFEQLIQVCRAAARFLTTRSGFSICFNVQHKVATSTALSGSTHLFECPVSILKKYKISPKRE